MGDATPSLHRLRLRLRRWMPVWLLGWLALSLMQIVQPCCDDALAAQTGHGSHAHVAEPHLQVAGMPHVHGGEPNHCSADAGPVCHPALLSRTPVSGKDLAKASINAMPQADARGAPDLRLATLAPAPAGAHPPYLLTLRLRL